MLPAGKEEKFIPTGRFSDFLEDRNTGKISAQINPELCPELNCEHGLAQNPVQKTMFLQLRVLSQGILGLQLLR